MEIPTPPETKAGKFLSFEILVTMCVSLAAIAVSWGALNADVSANQEDVNDLKTKQEFIKTSVTEIEKDVAIIATEQRHLIQQQEQNKTELRYIRNLLEREFGRTNGARPDD